MARPRKVEPPTPKPRAKRGQGSVWPRKDGRWGWAVTLEGRRRAGTEPDEATARAVLDGVKAALPLAGTETAGPDPNLTLGDFLDEWLRDIVRPYLSENTATNYAQMAEQHIRPVLGSKRLRDLTREDVQRLINEVAKKTARRSGEPLSPKTVKNVHAVLSGALKQAVEWKRIPENVASRPRMPKARKPIIVPLDEAEVDRFLDAARSDRYAVAFAIAVLLGLRKTEILNLEWSDLDLDGRRLHVRGTKTPHSDRHVVLMPDLVGPLRRLRARWQEEKLGIPSGEWSAGDRLFTTEDGRPVPPRTFYRHFERTIQAAGVKRIRFHDLRHTCATLRIRRREPIPSVSKLLGHADPALTLRIYAHVLESMSEEGAERMEGFLGAF